MNYSFLISTSLLLMALGFSGYQKMPEHISRAAQPDAPHRINLSWIDSPAATQAITWRTNGRTPVSFVEYCKASASPFFQTTVRSMKATSVQAQADDGVWNHHSVNVKDLEPGTIYSYRVGNGEYWSEWSEFTTASAGTGSFSFLYFGDVQRDIHSLGSRILRQAIRNKPDAKFLLFGGDMVHRGALNRDNWDDFFLAAGSIFQHYPLVSTPGNHEHNNAKSGIDLSDNWFLNFSFPENGPQGHQEETFVLDYRNLRIISLNLCRYRYPDDRKVLLAWFEDRLKEVAGQWVMVVHHYAMVSCKAHKEKPPVRFPEFKAIYEKYNVPLVLQGHEHVYARGSMDEDFPVYVVSVAGPHQNAFYFDDWIDRAGTSLQLFQEIDVTPDSLHYVSKTVLGDVYDEFFIVRDGNSILSFYSSPDLPPESLIPPPDFAERYDPEIVRNFTHDRDRYLKRTKLK